MPLHSAWADGFCAATREGEGRRCRPSDTQGSWPAGNALKCEERCRACERCSFISWSASLEDCSWFSHCGDLAHLNQTVGRLRTKHRTLRVRDPNGQLLPRATRMQKSNHSARVAQRLVLSELARPKDGWHSQFGQDKCVAEAIFKWRVGGTYVDLAANDPVRISNTYALDRRFGWRGRDRPRLRPVSLLPRGRT
jgi:hypothetical protein